MPLKGRQAEPDDRMRLVHMRDAASEALQFVIGITREQFQTERMRQRAVTNCVQEIGEAAARTSDHARARVPALPWPKIVGMRHILVHSYFDVDVGAVWRVVVNELPELVRVIDAALSVWPVDTASVQPDRRPVMGVDGCPAGWCAFTGTSNDDLTFHVFENLAALWRVAASCRLVLIDVPIGLPDHKRECDLLAKSILGRFNSRVFLTPPRTVVHANNYAEAAKACKAIANFGLAKQTWNICPKIRMVDEFLRATPAARQIIRECHPEICFWSLAGRVLDNKTTDEGFDQRFDILASIVPATPDLFSRARATHRPKAVSNDDILDALVAAVTALAPPQDLRTLPSNPPRDVQGLRIEMVHRASVNITPASR